MKKVLILLFFIFMISGCASSKVDIQKIMDENEYIIVDVRTKEEYDDSHLVDAINIPYDTIDESVDLDKEKVIFVYCKSGNRSQIAFQELVNLGYTVYDLGAFSEIDLPKE